MTADFEPKDNLSCRLKNELVTPKVVPWGSKPILNLKETASPCLLQQLYFLIEHPPSCAVSSWNPLLQFLNYSPPCKLCNVQSCYVRLVFILSAGCPQLTNFLLMLSYINDVRSSSGESSLAFIVDEHLRNGEQVCFASPWYYMVLPGAKLGVYLPFLVLN
ncbi:hypothetical protein KY285_008538 [Solanum tuberosum]|nr:hypothetical protein KY285_008538 [Solanum tuberosum]